MIFLQKYGFYFLLLGVISDLSTPYILGLFYPKLNQMTTVISVFSDVDSPVRRAFLVWSVVSGLFFCSFVACVVSPICWNIKNTCNTCCCNSWFIWDR